MQRRKLFILSVRGVPLRVEGGCKNGPEGLSERGVGGQGGTDTGTEKEESMGEGAQRGTSMQRMKFIFGGQTRLGSEFVPPTPHSLLR